MSNHVMLDLETWGTVPGCAIRSIGAVRFDPQGREIYTSTAFYRNVDDKFGHRDHDTVAWWDKQSDAAKAALETEKHPLGTALADLTEWWKYYQPEFLWSHGASFDVPVLAVAYWYDGSKPPWDFRKVRDTRTLFDVTALDGSKYGRAKATVAHNALDDAVAQALDVQSSYRVLRDLAKRASLLSVRCEPFVRDEDNAAAVVTASRAGFDKAR